MSIYRSILVLFWSLTPSNHQQIFFFFLAYCSLGVYKPSQNKINTICNLTASRWSCISRKKKKKEHNFQDHFQYLHTQTCEAVSDRMVTDDRKAVTLAIMMHWYIHPTKQCWSHFEYLFRENEVLPKTAPAEKMDHSLSGADCAEYSCIWLECLTLRYLPAMCCLLQPACRLWNISYFKLMQQQW